MFKLIKFALCGLFLVISVSLFSSNGNSLIFAQTIANRLTKQWKNNPQEKVYLQTDKPYYSAGEDIWFKGYLVNATTLEPNSMSKYLYVELIDKSDSVQYRVKIRKDSLGFAGNIKLRSELPSGQYALRAYTYWMQNATSDFFFSKNIYIGNPIDDQVTSQITYGTPEKGKIPVTLSFTNASKNPIANKSILIYQNWKIKSKKKMIATTNTQGKIYWQMDIDATDHAKKSIDVSINDPYLKYKNKFYVPEFGTDFDVQFLPESGVLLNNQLQTIAFKAIGADGLSVDVSGRIFTNKDEEITNFTSANKGMGKFMIDVKPNETYYAIVKSTTGIEKKFNIPTSVSEGISLHVVYNKGKILYEVINQTNQPSHSLYLLVHSRGNVCAIQPLTSESGQITESLLPPGIVSFSILDSIGNILCERLTFVRNTAPPTLSVKSDKTTYGKRELVNLKLDVKSLLGKTVAGDFSMSVTDSRTVRLDSLGDNILSNLLLTSDLKGYIEDPGSYFKDNGNLSRENLDILMMTQGWRRFETAQVLKGKYKSPTYYLEAGQAISGKVLNLLGKPSRKADIIMISPANKLIRTAQTDSTGRYMLAGFEFPDSTSFVLKARKKRTFGDVEIVPDVDDFPKYSSYIPTPRTEIGNPPTDYFEQSKQKYYTEGGIRVINLNEITVKGERKNTDSSNQYYSGMGDSEINSERLEKSPGMAIMTMLSTIAGVQVMGENISIRGSQGLPMILIDNMETQGTEELTYLTTNDVENISVFKGANAAIFGSRGGNGVIAITLKTGVVTKVSGPISMAQISPLGYQKATQFYVPKYAVDSVRLSVQPDLRTTIYWNPSIKTDTLGTANVNLYTADKANNYSIVVEGVTNDGEICRYVGTLRREGF